MALGKAGVAGSGTDVFSGPCERRHRAKRRYLRRRRHIADTPVNRIMKFSKDGTFIKAWGKRGRARRVRHAAQHRIDSRGRIFVADRSNSRIQIFDQNGTFLDQWKQFGRPSGIHIDRNDSDGRRRFAVEFEAESRLYARHLRRQRTRRQGHGLIPFRSPMRRRTTTPASRRGDRRQRERLRRGSQHRDVEEVREGGVAELKGVSLCAEIRVVRSSVSVPSVGAEYTNHHSTHPEGDSFQLTSDSTRRMGGSCNF
jgi:hypothetical protein